MIAPPKPSHVFLDFDETLFNHISYFDWADAYLAENFKIQPGSFKASIGLHHDKLDGRWTLYHHMDHIQASAKRKWEYLSGELDKAIVDEALDFCYTEVHRVLRWLHQQAPDLRVLTFGDGEYQRYKLSMCPLMHKLRLPVHVVHEAKADFLKHEFSGVRHGVLVDDKHPLDLPANWTHIWINRQQQLAKPAQLNAHTWQISNLHQLKLLI